MRRALALAATLLAFGGCKYGLGLLLDPAALTEPRPDCSAWVDHLDEPHHCAFTEDGGSEWEFVDQGWRPEGELWPDAGE